MKQKQMRILQEFAVKLRCKYPKAQIWAFGSYARGTATAESDLDMMVVLPQMQQDDRFVVSDIAWEVGFAHGLHLSTVVVSKENFEHGPVSASPLLEAVRNEGIPA